MIAPHDEDPQNAGNNAGTGCCSRPDALRVCCCHLSATPGSSAASVSGCAVPQRMQMPRMKPGCGGQLGAAGSPAPPAPSPAAALFGAIPEAAAGAAAPSAAVMGCGSGWLPAGSCAAARSSTSAPDHQDAVRSRSSHGTWDSDCRSADCSSMGCQNWRTCDAWPLGCWSGWLAVLRPVNNTMKALDNSKGRLRGTLRHDTHVGGSLQEQMRRTLPRRCDPAKCCHSALPPEAPAGRRCPTSTATRAQAPARPSWPKVDRDWNDAAVCGVSLICSNVTADLAAYSRLIHRRSQTMIQVPVQIGK